MEQPEKGIESALLHKSLIVGYGVGFKPTGTAIGSYYPTVTISRFSINVEENRPN